MANYIPKYPGLGRKKKKTVCLALAERRGCMEIDQEILEIDLGMSITVDSWKKYLTSLGLRLVFLFFPPSLNVTGSED